MLGASSVLPMWPCVCMHTSRTYPLLPHLLCSPRVCQPCNQARRRWQTLRRNWWHSSRSWSGEHPCGQMHNKPFEHNSQHWSHIIKPLSSEMCFRNFHIFQNQVPFSPFFFPITTQPLRSMFSDVAFNLLFRLMSRSCSLLPVCLVITELFPH